MMKKTLKKTCFAFCSGILLIGGMTGCSLTNVGNSSTKQVVYCKPVDKTKVADYIEVVLGSDGKTIEQYTYKKYINEDYIKSLAKVSSKTEDKLFQEYADSYQLLYNQYVVGNQNVSWISYKYVENDEKKTIEFVMSFDFTDETFKLDKDTRGYLMSTMPFKYFYNKDEMKLEYQDILEEDFEKSGLIITCSTSEKDLSQTLHSKTVEYLTNLRKTQNSKNN